MSPRRHSQSGNIFLYVLGAIFLMGILVVMIKGASMPGAGIDPEQIAIKASDVQQYGSELERAVGFVIQNGYSENDVRFANPVSSGLGYGDITSIPARQVFSRNGGGATWRDPPAIVQTTTTPWIFTGKNAVMGIGTTCAANACADLVAILPNVTKSFCLEINNRDSIDNAGGNPPADTANVDIATKFNDSTQFSYSDAIGTGAIGATTGALFGHKEGCFEGGGTPAAGTYHYYRVLMAR